LTAIIETAPSNGTNGSGRVSSERVSSERDERIVTPAFDEPGDSSRWMPSSFGELIDVVRQDWRVNGRDWTKPGFRALAVHRFGNWRMTFGSFVARAPLARIYRAMFRFVRNHYGIEIEYTVRLGRGVIIEHQSGIVVNGYATLGDGCILRQGVTIGNRRLDDPTGVPVFGRDVNIGAGASVLGRITIGDGAQIGSNSDDVPAGATAVGIPARIVKVSPTTTATTA
jgi:serine O-acetyltransferase